MRKITRMLLLAICIIFCPAVQVMAEEPPAISGSSVLDGEEVKVSVTVDNGGAASGQFVVEYDPKIVEIVNAEVGNSLAADITSVNLEYKDHSAVYVGFANAGEGIQAGELLAIEFKMIGTLPEEGTLFPVTVVEWDGAKQDQPDYEISLKPEGSGDHNDNNNGNDNGNDNGNGNDSTEAGEGNSQNTNNGQGGGETGGQNTNVGVSSNNNAAVTAAQINTAVNTSDNASFAGAGFIMIAGICMVATAMKKHK